MALRIVLRPEAQSDLLQARDWYEHEASELAEAFADSFEAMIARIETMPELYAVALKNTRRAKLRRFPYLVYYRVLSDRIEVIGVTSRNPSLRMVKDRLRASLMPTGFEQHQLPIPLRGEDILCFITTGEPNAEFPEHRHYKNDGLRVVISGSISYEGIVLTAGDWMYVPRGASYSFVVGTSGCALFHGYPVDPPK